MPTVLSVQSWVACGNVGNCAALFPLQRLGCETWSLNTVAFSNHTGYEKWRGDTVPASEIATLFDGIAELGVLPRCDAVLSGYLGEAETGPVLLDIVARVKKANPRALFAAIRSWGMLGSDIMSAPASRSSFAIARWRSPMSSRRTVSSSNG